MHGAVTRVARADNYDSRIHLHGVYAQSGVQSGTNWGALDGYTVQNGDHLYWRQYNSGANGGINLQAGSVNLSSSLSDTSGAPVADMTQQAKWVNREVDLSPGAGYTLTNAQFVTDASTSAGTSDMLFGDLTLMHSDGSIIQLFDRGTSFGFGSYFANGGGVSGQSSIVETVTTSTVEPTPAIAAMPEITTTYYVSDQIGSARSEVSFGSWPLWWGSFDPFGVETDTNTTPNNFKFTGQERDAESGNDYFKARSYASNLGRFISPDPSGLTFAEPANPQSLNLYNYVLNNPLSLTDPDGLHWECAGQAAVTVEGGPDDQGGHSGTYTSNQGCANWVWVQDGPPQGGVPGGQLGGSKSPAQQSPNRAPNKPCAVSSRVAQGIVGVANVGDAYLRAQAVIAGTVALAEAPPAAAVFAIYGTTSVFGQATAGVAQITQAVTGNGGAKPIEQVGNILAGPAAGLTTLVAGGSAEQAETNANRESFFNGGVGLVNKATPLLLRLGEFALGAVGLGSVGCGSVP